MSSILNTKWYNPNHFYSDGSIEQEIYDRLKKGVSPQDLLKEDDRWPVLYHFSPLRENIVSWLPVKDNASILEIGSGMGAVSGALQKKAGHLTCVDLSMLRSQINALRNQNASNMEIIVANLNDIIFEQTYDIVTLIGVLEYSGRYTDGETPYLDFLHKVFSLVKPGGTLIIAIENRLGLKYFAGAKEDHYGVPFYGLNGYPQDQGIRTFSLPEIRKLLNDSGCAHYEVFLPQPDYKFPTTIVSEEASSFFTESLVAENNYGAYLNTPFNQKFVYQSLIEQNSFVAFANSFLILAGKD